MNTRKGTLFVVMILFLVFAGGMTYSWFANAQSNDTQGVLGYINMQMFEAVAQQRAMRSFSVMNTTKLEKSFNVQNNSNIDSYVRISYTVHFKDQNGNEALQDVSSIKPVSVQLSTSNGERVIPLVQQSVTATGYSKDFIYPMEEFENKQYYFRVGPGVKLSGVVNFGSVEVDRYTPELIVSTETIQGTTNAIKDAEQYGWDSKYVLEKVDLVEQDAEELEPLVTETIKTE